MKKKKKVQRYDQEVLDAYFHLEKEWKTLRSLVDKSVDPLQYTEYQLKLAQAKYMFLLKEIKHRNITFLKDNF